MGYENQGYRAVFFEKHIRAQIPKVFLDDFCFYHYSDEYIQAIEKQAKCFAPAIDYLEDGMSVIEAEIIAKDFNDKITLKALRMLYPDYSTTSIYTQDILDEIVDYSTPDYIYVISLPLFLDLSVTQEAIAEIDNAYYWFSRIPAHQSPIIDKLISNIANADQPFIELTEEQLRALESPEEEVLEYLYLSTPAIKIVDETDIVRLSTQKITISKL